jgi:hypothetical protein
MRKQRFLLLIVTLSLPTIAVGQGSPNPLATDSGLIAHLKKTDPVLRQALGDCTDEVVERTTQGARTSFVYRASCQQRVPPREAGDCNYRVEGRGTIDSSEWATVRSWRLDLRCHG